MSMIGKALKIGALAKVIQVVQREASKPENRQKMSEAMTKYKNKRAGGAAVRPTD